MAEIKEFFEGIKDGLGDKGFLIFIGACVLLFVMNLNKDNSSEVVPVTAVTHYPDLDTNANVVIDTLQDSIEYSEKEIIEAIGGLDTKFEATENFIKEGLDSQYKLMEENFDEIQGSLTDISNKSDVISNINAMTYYELMLLQGREGHIPYNPSQALGALKNTGFNTSKENATNAKGKLTGKAGSKDGNWTTFTGSNIKKK